MNDSSVYASLYPVGSFPFPLPKMGSLTVEEAEYMADHVRANDLARLDSLEKFATAIAEREKITIEEAILSVTKLVDGTNEELSEAENLKLMKFSINYKNYIAEMQKQNNPIKINNFQTKETALMILVSRLDAQWLVENLKEINKRFRLSLEPGTVGELLAIPEEQWLSSPKRKNIFARILNKLPISEIRELAGFVLAEEREWESIDDSVSQEKKVFSNGYEIIEMGSQNNDSSIETPITESVPETLPIQSSTESDTTVAPVTSSEKRSKK